MDTQKGQNHILDVEQAGPPKDDCSIHVVRGELKEEGSNER